MEMFAPHASCRWNHCWCPYRRRRTHAVVQGLQTVRGVALWLVYGIALGSGPILIINAITLVLAAACCC